MGKGWILAGGVLLGVSIFVGWRGHKEAAALRAANRELQARLATLDMERTNALARPTTESIPAVSPELLKLRGEVAQLRRQTNEMQKLQSENTRLRAAMVSAAQTQPKEASANNTNSGSFVPREAWAFAGYATPDDALRSAVWAMSSGDPNTFLASLSPRERARTEKQWKDKSDEQIAAEGRREMEKMSGFHILDRQVVADDEVTLRVFAEGDEGDVRRMRMKRFGSEWKIDGVSSVKRDGEQR
jgi:hypothetical protein